ncbi:MAG: SDR family NAD(P)-dependent oxidoreductase [Clostridia bacterium]|nr:SDR family NAD(P)-dependent oxidoreductase [Clostridia bacterium]
MKTAILTGASAGFGVELLRAAIKLCPDIDTYWLIARREDRLKALQAQFPEKKLRAVPLDLTDPAALSRLKKILNEEKPEITLLMNNAGAGKLCDFAQSTAESQLMQVDLNCRALTAVTRHCLPYMQMGSLILNVSSIASFAPTPRMTVYCATKSYVQAFSRALREELTPQKINVLAVCPGPMDTEFLGVAGIERGGSPTFDTLPHQNPTKMAEKALKAGLAGRSAYTMGPFYKFYRVLAHLLPKCILMKFTRC